MVKIMEQRMDANGSNEHVFPAQNESAKTERGEVSPSKLSEFAAQRKQVLIEFEKKYLTELLEKTGGNVARAARESGIARQHLFAKIKSLCIDPDTYR